MWWEKLAKDESNLVPFIEMRDRVGCIILEREEQGNTYLKRALSSENPTASASTAAGVPIFRNANMARYRLNNGSLMSSRVARRADTVESEIFSGLNCRARSFDMGGAGSTDAYVLG
jgi:hypothetical protein